MKKLLFILTSCVALSAQTLTPSQFSGFTSTATFPTNIDRNSEQFKQADKILKSAFELGFGDVPTTSGYLVGKDEKVQASAWMCEYIQSAPYNMAAQYAAGLKFADAMKAVRIYLAQPQNSEKRAEIITRAYLEVLGRKDTPTELSYWDAKIREEQKAYVDIVAANKSWLNAPENKEVRIGVIKDAYENSMGRRATDTDIAYWKDKSQHYTQLLEECRNWMYSTQGATDLTNMIKTAYRVKFGAVITDEKLKQNISKCTETKPIYKDLISTANNFLIK